MINTWMHNRETSPNKKIQRGRRQKTEFDIPEKYPGSNLLDKYSNNPEIPKIL